MEKRIRMKLKFGVLVGMVLMGFLNEIKADRIETKKNLAGNGGSRIDHFCYNCSDSTENPLVSMDTIPVTTITKNEFGYTSWYIPFSLRLSPSVQVYTGSNVLPQALLNKIVFGGYLDPALIGKVEGRLKPFNRLGFEQFNELGFYYKANASEFYGVGYRTNRESLGSAEIITQENSKITSWADRGLLISGENKRVKAGTNDPSNEIENSQKKKYSVWMGLNYSVLAGARFTDDAYRALLRGNGYYLGKTLDIGNNRFKQLGYVGADFIFFKNGDNGNSLDPLKSKTIRIPISWMVSVRNLSSFQLLRTDGLELFTSPAADSLSLDGRFYQVGLKGGSINPGITVGFNQFLLIGKNGTMRANVNLSLEDFGVYYLQNANVLSRGYAWDANGKGFSPSSESSTLPVYLKQASVTTGNLQLGNWFTQQVDTAEARLRVVEQVRSGWIMSPFKVSIKTNIFTLSYRNLPGMMPLFSVYPGLRTRQVHRLFAEVFNLKKDYLRKELGSNSKLFMGFSVGGFDKVNWRLGYETDYLWLGKAVRFRADIVGVEALLAPKTYHGFGFNLSALALF